MDFKQTRKKICPVIGVLLPMVLIYIVFCSRLQISEYSPFLNSSKIVTMKSNNGQLSKRRILASPLLLAPIPLEKTASMFRVYSVVPVRAQQTFAGAALAIIGETANDTYGNHFVKYNDNSFEQVFKVRKYTKVNYYGRETTWYAEMPDEIAVKMFNPDSTLACTIVTVLLGENETMVNAVADFNVCHNPSILPKPENKVDIAYCINTPPFFSSEIDYVKGKLSGGMAMVVPNILYHLHSGVDLFVVYIPVSIRQLYLQLLEPLIARYGHRLLFVDLSFKWVGKQFIPYDLHGQGNYDWQNPLSQDCLNRLKGHSRFFRTIDVDEYDMIFSYSKKWGKYTPNPFTLTYLNFTKNLSLAWDDENYKMPYINHAIEKLRSQDSHMKNSETFDCLYFNQIWFIRKGTENERILPHTKTYIPFEVPKYGKCLCRPERIAVTWVHAPTNCFGPKPIVGDCQVEHINVPEDETTNDKNSNNGSKKKRKQIMELGYAHIRESEWSSAKEFMNNQKAKGHLIHTSLFNEVLKKIEDELVDLYETAIPADLLKATK